MEKPCCKSCAKGKQCESQIYKNKKIYKNLSSHNQPSYTYGAGDDEVDMDEYRGKYMTNEDVIRELEDEFDKPRVDKNKIDFIIDDASVIQAIVRPDRHKLVSFPYFFNTPGTPIHKFNTLPLVTNSNGVAWAEVNFGQYLGINAYSAGTGGVAGSFGTSNVFYSNSALTGFDGVSPFVVGTTNKDNIIASTVLREEIDMYNAVRAGPAAVWYDFTGRLDISSGIVTCGINYTFYTDVVGGVAASTANGLLPDPNFITLKSIEDCPYKQSCSVVDSVQACFIPHDQAILDLKNPQVGNAGVQQRFFILITGAAPNEKIGQLKIVMNFDGKPNSKYADNISTSITKSPSIESLKSAADWLITNGKVIRVIKDQGYGIKRFDTRFG